MRRAHQVVGVGPGKVERLARVLGAVLGLHHESGATPGDKILDEAVVGA